MPDNKRVVTINFEGVESGGGRVRVPEGDYGLKIVKVVSKTGEESKKPYLSIDFKLTKGDKKGVGKTLTGHSCSLQKQSLWNLRNLLESCGKQVPSKAVKIDLDKMVGWECAGTVIDDQPYEGKIKSIISAFFPISDLGKTSSNGDELETAGGSEEPEAEAEADDTEELFN